MSQANSPLYFYSIYLKFLDNIFFTPRATGKALICLAMMLSLPLASQDLEPRRWTNLPVGTHIIGVGYGYTFGDIFFDPVLQAENATISVHTIGAQYVQPFKLGNKLARLDALVPYSFAKWEGLLAGEPTTVQRNGFADPRLRLSVNFLGPKAMTGKELQQFIAEHPIYTTVGASLAVTFPLGQYYEDKLLNLGQNRFVFRPQLGVIHTRGLWSYEFSGSLFIFSNNNEFFNGVVRKQDPVYSFQVHIIKRFKNRMWASFSVGSGLGGQSIINRQPNDDERGDILTALSVSSPMVKNQSVKIALIHSETLNDIGSNTTSIAVGWSFIY